MQFGEFKNMYYRKLVSVILATTMMVGVVVLVSGKSTDANKNQRNLESVEPLNLAVLIQDDLVSQVGNELEVTRTFIRSMPRGSRVMVGYITSGTLQVRQPFTTDLEKAAKSLRIPTSSISSSPYNPYVEVIEALRKFEGSGTNANALLLISDGLDTSRGFDSTAAGHTLDIERT